MSLRLYKKQQTKQNIIACAFSLITARGYNKVTIHDITNKAGVSPRTFFSYFTSKEDAIFQPLDELANGLSEAFSSRPTSAKTIDIFEKWLRSAVKTLTECDTEEIRAWRAVINKTPALKARELTYFNKLEKLLEQEFAKETPVQYEAQLLAASTSSMLRTMYIRASEVGFSPAHQTEINHMIDAVMRLLQRSIGTATD